MGNKLKAFDKGSIALLSCSMMNSIIGLFTNTFLMGYMFQVSTDNVKNIGLYYVFLYIVLFSGYWLFSYIVKKTDRVSMYRFSSLIKFLYVLLLVLFGESLQKNIILMGVLYGLSEAFYYSSYNVIRNEILTTSKMKTFISLSSICGNTINIVFPIIFGLMLDFITIANSAVFVLGFVVLQLIFSIFVPGNKSNKTKFEPFKYLQVIKSDKNKYKNIWRVYILSAMEGFRGVQGTLLTLVIVMTFGNMFGLGYITSIFSALNILIVVTFYKFYNENKSKIILTIMSILPVLSVLILVLNITKTTFLIYNVVYAICLVTLTILLDLRKTQAICKSNLKKYISEHWAFAEFFLTCGRMVGYGLLLLIGIINIPILFNIYIAFSMCIVPFYGYYIYKIDRDLKNDIELETVDEDVKTLDTSISTKLNNNDDGKIIDADKNSQVDYDDMINNHVVK